MTNVENVCTFKEPNKIHGEIEISLCRFVQTIQISKVDNQLFNIHARFSIKSIKKHYIFEY